ncbi:MAG TPA: Na+/H+ antiporter NhaA [Myxococcaceae bacterium]|nr:Na+/H+ antiporter NhaA [Myxococcaceae bacterium]
MSRPAKLPPIFRAVVEPIRVFFRLEATGGILLFAAAVGALVWANSPFGAFYRSLLSLQATIGVGSASVHFTVAELVNDGLMSIFFFVVGMEIKRELVLGELRTPSRALLPAIAAMGGMIVPAGLYLAFNAGRPGASGWAIPMATDIAFTIGCLTLLKGRVPHALVVFITALAIFDDLGGILVIAFFYGHGLHVDWLLGALAVTGLLYLFNRFYVRNPAAYVLGGMALWYMLHHGGIHATISGVILGMMIPARQPRPMREILDELRAYASQLLSRPEDEYLQNEQLLHIEQTLEEVETPLNRFVHALHPWVAYVIMPVFALANSGILLSGISLADLGDRVVLGSIVGLFFGKQVGVFLFTLAALKLRFSTMPGGASIAQLYGVSVLTGIGFTVALFIAGLAFPDSAHLLDQAKLGILLGSLVSGVVGYVFLRLLKVRPAPPAAAPSVPA